MNTFTTRAGRPAARRSAAVAAALVAGALTLTACSGDSGALPEDEESSSTAEEGPVEIRFAWWGSDTRHQTTQEIIDLFEEKNPDITVVPDFTDWSGYWDKLATSVAAGDAPDVITQEERYLADYASRGVLADLAELDVDTSAIDESIVKTGETDGGLYGIPTGVNAYTVLADPQAFEAAGVEIPDDTTWTWEDYVETANAVAAGSEGVYGTQDYGFNEAGISIRARQLGEALYTADGELGVSEETVADFFQTSLDLQAGGGEPDAARSVEIEAAGPEGSLLGTNTGAMGFWWSNQLGAVSTAAGRDLELLRVPGESDGERTGMYLKPAMYYSVAETSEHPEAAAKFVDFLLNDPEAGALMLSDRGLPANVDVREAILPDLPPTDQQVASFIEEISEDIVDGPAVPPQGAGDVTDILIRVNTEVLFGNLSPADAAAQFMTEVEAAIGG
ncbi:extracellular solute-binding protein [Cellulosimicrobium sp. Marseille-Q4280]|jgi:multiple sugar transport system substrate-binding protein|uniref:ABC transporter substrate-binding protein n=1 Tax=Cellulosimicrobium sp. Marseille-Q4280 TaxID=2937992 RepID=UPI00203E9CC2|nr:extracellular solute-binding protein [Cellulosimicrobium sp. Marseille-Q4280]